MYKKDLIKVIIGSIIVGLSILGMAFSNWLIDIGIGIVLPILGIIIGGFLMFYGIYSALETVEAKGFFQIITGLIIIGLSILWIIKIYWPVITGKKPYGLGLEVMELTFPLNGIIFGGLQMIFGFISLFKKSKKSIRQKELKESWFSIERKRIIFLILRILLLSIGIVLVIFSGLAWYGWPVSIFAGVLCIFFGIYYLLPNRLSRGIFLVVLGGISLTAGIFLLYLSQITPGLISMSIAGRGLSLIIVCIPLFSVGRHNLRKAIRQKELKKIREKKEMLGAKIEAAPNVTYMLRIEKEIGESEAERTNYICGYCGLKSNLKTIDEDRGIFQCLNCGAENHLLK